MPPTRTRAATSATVRPVRTASRTLRAGRRAAEPSQGALGERVDTGGRGSREPTASVPSKSITTRSGGGDSTREAIAAVNSCATGWATG